MLLHLWDTLIPGLITDTLRHQEPYIPTQQLMLPHWLSIKLVMRRLNDQGKLFNLSPQNLLIFNKTLKQ